MTRTVFLDTAVLAYAVGGEHVQRGPCRAVVAAATAGELELHVSAEAIQELLFHRMRRTTRAIAIEQVRLVRQLCVVHALDDEVLDGALEIFACSAMRGRDAIHAASALAAGFETIVSPDWDFDAAPGLERLEPSAVSSRSPARSPSGSPSGSPGKPSVGLGAL